MDDTVAELQRKYALFAKSLYTEGLVDSQFMQLQQLQDESNPNFVTEVISLFLSDSEKLLNKLGFALQEKVVDYVQVTAHVQQFKGSSACIGAQRVKNLCIAFVDVCKLKSLQGCLRCFQQVKSEFDLLKNRLDALSRLGGEIEAAGGSVPVL